MKANKNIYWVDLFSGAGGTSTGIHLAGQKVVACVNHDAGCCPNITHNGLRLCEAVDFEKQMFKFKQKLK